MAVAIPGSDAQSKALADFSQDAETEFRVAEGLLSNSTLDLEATRSIVLNLRTLALEHRGRGCDDLQMEKWILQRTRRITKALVDGHELSQAEVYEPRQTMVLVFCAMAVFPASIRLVEENDTLVYKFSTDECRDCYDYLAVLTKYCTIKTDLEGPFSPQNFLRHLQLLLDVAMWLEREWAVVAFLIVTEGFIRARDIAIVADDRNVHLMNPRAAAEVRRLYKASLIIKASCLICLGFVDEANKLFPELRGVDQLYLPPALTAKLAYVQAVLFKENGHYAKSMDRARTALSQTQDVGERMKIRDLIEEVNHSLQNGERDVPSPTDPDEDWLEGTNARLPQAYAKKQDEVRRKHHQQQQQKPKHRRPKRETPERSAPSVSPLVRGYPSMSTRTSLPNSTCISHSSVNSRSPRRSPSDISSAEGAYTSPFAVNSHHMSSEKGDSTVSLHPVQFRRAYTTGQVVQVQMSAEPKQGIMKPRVEILHTAHNSSVCTQHSSDPVLALTCFATRPTREQQFSSYKDYVQAWMPLLEMEAAVAAGNSDGGVVIDNVAVVMKTQTSSNGLLYRGTFDLKATFCYDHCIEFGGKSVDSIRQDEFKSDNSFPLDYLCLRYKMDCSDSVVSRVKQSEVSETVDRQFTWMAHASVVQVTHKDRQVEDGGCLVVTFVLSPSSPQPPPQLMTKEGARLTLELLPKSDVDRRAQEMLLSLQDDECQLAQAIAFGAKIPELDYDHKKLGLKDTNHDVSVPNSARKSLPMNNTPQLEAIKLAMTHSLSIIHCPPGSGKRIMGIKLVYLFCKINRQLEAEGKGKKTVLYCGPSNKSVDLVARELKSKLGTECPKIVRVYGSAIEAKDYPVPWGDLRSTRGIHDLKCDPDLQDTALHHLIRQDGKPHAEEISVFEKYFFKCCQEPDKYSVSSEQLKEYYRLLFVASVEELKHYEVVLATCAVGGNHKLVEGTLDSVFQLIIDECAMSPEPQSMVPIIATRAQQVVLIGDHKQLRPIIKCQPAAELGLDQSLFERLFLKFPAYTVFLSTQYRMHPEICAFPSKEFYNNELMTGYSVLWGGELLPFWPGHPLYPDRPVPHLLVDVRGEEETLTVTTNQGNERSKSNSLEADKVVEILKFLKREFRVDLLKIKLLTQYNAQRHLLEEKVKAAIVQHRNMFEHNDKFKINVSTVVSSQGGEWDYVILSTVRSLPSYKIEPNPTHGWCRQNLGFITDHNQVNVALTRARIGLFIVGNVELLRCDDMWRHLVERYERNGCCVSDASEFPPPPAPRDKRRQWHMQHNASDHWH